MLNNYSLQEYIDAYLDEELFDDDMAIIADIYRSYDSREEFFEDLSHIANKNLSRYYGICTALTDSFSYYED